MLPKLICTPLKFQLFPLFPFSTLVTRLDKRRRKRIISQNRNMLTLQLVILLPSRKQKNTVFVNKGNYFLSHRTIPDRLSTTEPIESPMQQRPKIWRVYSRRGKGGQQSRS